MNETPENYRHVPFDIEVEQATLGACLIDNRQIERVSETLKASHFYDPLHARLFEVMASGRRLWTPLTLNAEMKNDPGLIEVGGHAYLATLAESAPSLPNVRDYAAILTDLSVRRDLIRLGTDVVNEAYDAPHDRSSAEIITTTSSKLLTLSTTNRVWVPPSTADMLGARIVAAAERALAGERPPAVTTGLDKLNAKIGGGYRGGNMILVAGPSGMGKSAYMGGTALASATAGFPTLIFSFDMTEDEWWQRTLCDRAFDLKEPGQQSIWYSRLRDGKLNNGEVGRIEMARQSMIGIPLEICDQRDLTIDEVLARAKAFKARYPSPLGKIVIDYAQKVRGKGQTREREVASVAEGIKNLAGELKWPVEAGCQVNTGEQGKRIGEEHKPTLEDLRESRVLGNEADLVLAPWRRAHWIRMRKPDASAGPNEMEAWKSQYVQWEHRFGLLCLKYRHGHPFNELSFYTDMGASAIRDEEPVAGVDLDLLSLAESAR